jgi:hypothetical protein
MGPKLLAFGTTLFMLGRFIPAMLAFLAAGFAFIFAKE